MGRRLTADTGRLYADMDIQQRVDIQQRMDIQQRKTPQFEPLSCPFPTLCPPDLLNCKAQLIIERQE
jgi:hypothetical protein